MDLTDDNTLMEDNLSIDSPNSINGSGEGPLPSRKSRVAVACQRCKRRKQRCNGEHPVCTSCRKAKVDCVYERALRPRYPGGKSLYISALEERIAFLEARLPEFGQDHFVSPRKRDASEGPGILSSRRRVTSSASPALARCSSDDEEKSALVDGVAYLSLCASGTTDTAPEPFYVGSSSGATIARLIQSSIFRNTESRIKGPTLTSLRPDVLRPSLSELDNHITGAPEALEPTADEFPHQPQAQTLFAVFFDRLHTRWPVLDRRLFCTLFEKQWTQGALSIVHRSLLHLIYAISARFLQLMKKKCDVDPEQHFAAAIEPMDFILEQHNLATVQFLALLAIYGQRSPYGAGSWSRIRYAIAICIELGLHRKQAAHQQSLADSEIRKRVFWACYCLDRMTTITLGRTFAIADRDINVDMPSEDPGFWYLTASSAEEWPNIRPFAHIIKLRRLQSKVFRTVWRVDKDILSYANKFERIKLDGKIDTVKQQLDSWLREIPVPPEASRGVMWMYGLESTCYDSVDFFSLQYHKTVLSLYTALLPTLESSDHRFTTATRSSASICNIYKTLIGQKTLSYTIVALHSCFIAGLTLVYCLWREPELFDYTSLEATRSCSLCLTIFGEKWPGAVKYRDIFDAMSGGLLKSIVGRKPSTSDSVPRRAPLDLDMRFQNDCMPAIPEVSAESSMGGMPASEEPIPAYQNGSVLFGVVKDAFMEVDEESSAAGGWQGWRMFNEMVQSDIAMAPTTMGMGDESGLTAFE